MKDHLEGHSWWCQDRHWGNMPQARQPGSLQDGGLYHLPLPALYHPCLLCIYSSCSKLHYPSCLTYIHPSCTTLCYPFFPHCTHPSILPACLLACLHRQNFRVLAPVEVLKMQHHTWCIYNTNVASSPAGASHLPMVSLMPMYPVLLILAKYEALKDSGIDSGPCLKERKELNVVC